MSNAARSPDKALRNKADSPGDSRRLRSRWRLYVLIVGLFALASFAWLTGALALAPMSLARQAMQRRDSDKAEQWIRMAEWLHGDVAERELLHARLARRRGDLRTMEYHLKKAGLAGADQQRLFRERALAAAQAGQLREIETTLIEWLQEADPDSAEICDAYINGLAMQGRLSDAHMFLDGWQADFPNDPEPHLRRGRIAEHELDWESAEKQYRTALSKSPIYPPALYALGRLLRERKRPEEALPFYRSCVAHDAKTAAAANVGVASCLRLTGKIAEARNLLQGVLSQTDAQRAEAYIRVRDKPAGDPAAFELGKLESDETNYQHAEKWLRQSLAANPRDLEARYALGVALQRLGRVEEAKRELEQVSRVRAKLAEIDPLHDRLGSNPADVQARYQIGVTYLEHQSELVGVYWIQSALAYDPDYAPAHRALGEYYAARSRESKDYAHLAEFHQNKAGSATGKQP
jgi:tetratricopeptide (TPR) repeat protein